MTRGLVALVGRPNVGKSTLFNRLVGKRLAVVSDVAGTTRDRLYADSEWIGVGFKVVDTGGIELLEGWNTEPLSEDSALFLPSIRQQAQLAIDEADVIVLVVDGAAGLTAADREIGLILRQSTKPIFVAANKLESSKLTDNAYEFYELGLGEVFPISALHGPGVGDMLDRIVAELPAADPEVVDELGIKVTLIGRPNVGKSTLLNRLLGEERAIVSPIAGTTRDAFDSTLTWYGQKITLIDTAGIRRRGKIDQGIEKFSVLRTMRALERADVALLLIDGAEGVTSQDLHVAGMVREESVSLIVLINKWDAVEKDDKTIYEFSDKIRQELNFLPFVPFLFISAEDGQRTHKILPLVQEVYQARHHRIPTSQLNRIIREAFGEHSPPGKGTVVRFFYATQASVAPPTFVLFCNRPDLVHFTYRRYLENKIRAEYPFVGTPIHLIFRARTEEEDAKR